jgi:nicotinate-nucleotide adenylyltransferase
MRLGIFGGSFDPVHLGHLILAEQCRTQGALDRVLFVPSARPPHKADHELTRFDHRVEMLMLAISGNPTFAIDELEKDRPGPSYTVDTLGTLRQREPAAELWLILGGDSVVDLPKWYEPRRIVELAGLLVVGRPGVVLPAAEEVARSLGVQAVRMRTVASPLIEISSRELRRKLAASESVRYQTPRAVEAYIEDKRLYSVGGASTS